MTRWLLPDIITEEDSVTLLKEISFEQDSQFKHPLIRDIVQRIGEAINVKLGAEAPGYIRLENKDVGHKEHNDRGHRYERASGHMEWCDYGCSILLSEPHLFTGGNFLYTRDSPKLITASEHYLSAIVHTSDEFHRVKPHKGVRKVLLLFLPTERKE